MKYLPIGKLKSDFLERIISQYKGSPDPRVIIGPSIGEDAAIVSFSDKYLVAKTDPITFATDEIGWYVAHVNANDILTRRALPRWFMASILLPEGIATEEMAEEIFSQISLACKSLNVAIIGGHTEVTVGLDRPIVVGCMLGEAEKDRLIATSKAEIGDAIVITKGIAIEGTAIIAREKERELLKKGYSKEFIKRCKEFLYNPGISIFKEVSISKDLNIHSMHDPTEGGLGMGIYEICRASNTGAIIFKEKIPILEETETLCREYGIDPLGLITSGTLIATLPLDEAKKLVDICNTNNILASIIGEIKPKDYGIKISYQGTSRDLNINESDEILKVL
ncbi:MAG: AIR synthase family protein [bacterium]